MEMHNAIHDEPALCPAFRVRRGRRQQCAAMTSYVGSRASGYPPDLMPFRRSAGAADCDRNTRRGLRALRSCPYGSLERAVGKVLRSGGGDINRVTGAAKSQRDSSGKQRRRARPDDKPMTGFGGALDFRKDNAFDLDDRTNRVLANSSF